MSIFAFFHSTHDLHQLKKAQLPLRDSLVMKVQYISTIMIM